MPPKRPGKSLSNPNEEKMPKLINDEASDFTIIEDTRRKQIQEMKRAFNQNDSDCRRMLFLAREITKIPYLSSNLAMRLLKFCIQEENKYIARQLLENQSINLNTPEGNELLWYAVDKGQVDIFEMMLSYGADLSVRKFNEKRTILQAVLRNQKIKSDDKREKFIRLMLDNGADVNAYDATGQSVLQDAIIYENNSAEIVELLLKRGAQVVFNKGTDTNDLLRAACYKPEVLPKLIEHEVPDEETRNLRGAMAIYYLITKDQMSNKVVDVVQMIKNILDLGVPANSVDTLVEKRVKQEPSTLLSTALLQQERAVIKLLLDYGADPHQKNILGHTPLFQATAFKNYSHPSRWLIERGASIHDRNDDGCYPLHGACESKSLKNVHLFLNLGADVNVTNNYGCTPFSYTDETYYLDQALGLVIKHFALIIARGGKVNDKDMLRVRKYVWSENHFQKCMKQLEKMKIEKICEDVPYFSLFSKNIFSTMELMKKPEFVSNFKLSEKNRADLFPEYSYMLLHSFEITEKRYGIFLAEKNQVQNIFGEALPDNAIEKIAYYLGLHDLIQCEKDYYMTFHANLKNTRADKKKIL